MTTVHISHNIEAFVFKQVSEWEENNHRLQGEPGTWIRTSEPQIQQHLKKTKHNAFALIACPNCNVLLALTNTHHKVDELGKISPEFKCNRCSFFRQIYLDRYHVKPLYCMTYFDIWHDGSKHIAFLYTHATTHAEARKNMGHRPYEIIAIGPAIGFFVEKDKKDNEARGSILRA